MLRDDFWIVTEDKVKIFAREIRSHRASSSAEPLILVHGARVPGVGSFDLPVAGGSLAGDLADRTHRPVYLFDARNYGASDRNRAMSAAPQENPPQSRAHEVVRDIGAVVQSARERTGAARIALLGWATGGMWAGYYSTLHPETVGHLMVFNSLYGGSDRHPTLGRSSSMEDPKHPGRFNAIALGAYRFNTAASLTPSWDGAIPQAEKSSWRDPRVLDAYMRAAIDSDPESGSRTPPSFRSPTGALEDTFYQATGRQLFDAAGITGHLLVIRSERDFWSRLEDAATLVSHAARAASVESLTLRDATHYVHLDRSDRGRDLLIERIGVFLAKN
jgi:pimeloyl-ACP methyl ester carboxylesterase